MVTKDSVNIVCRRFYSDDRSVNGYQMCHLAESVDKHQDTHPIVVIGRNPKMKSIKTEHQASPAIGNDRRGACDYEEGFTLW